MLALAVEYVKNLQRQVKVSSKDSLKFIESHEDPTKTFFSQKALFFSLCRPLQIRKRNASARARKRGSNSLILMCTDRR